MVAGRPSGYKDEYCQQVILLGKEGMSKAEIAAELGVSKQTLYNWMEAHPEFLDAVKESTAFSQAWWEKKGRTAVFGGHPGFNSTAYIFTMKNMFGDDWRDKQEIDHSGEVKYTKVENVIVDPKRSE